MSPLPISMIVRSVVRTVTLILTLAVGQLAIASASELQFSRHLGTERIDVGVSIAVGAGGVLYVAGAEMPSGSTDSSIYVAMLDSTGKLIRKRSFDGSGTDGPIAMTIDYAGRLIVVGYTRSADFPITADAVQRTIAGDADGFLLILSPTGELIYGTYLGGAGYDVVNAVAVDQSGNIFVAGNTQGMGFPVTPNSLQPDFGGIGDAFITKFSPAGAIEFSTYLGGPSQDFAEGIAVDAFGAVYVSGYASVGFPSTEHAYRSSILASGVDAFVSKLNPAGTTLLYSTFLGAAASVRAIAVDAHGNAIVTGWAAQGYPVTSGASQSLYRGSGDTFLTKLNSTGSDLVFSTYLGGSSRDIPAAIAVDELGRIAIGGYTASSDFPVTAGSAQTLFRGGPFEGIDDYNFDGFVAQFDDEGTLLDATFVGGFGGDSVEALAYTQSGGLVVVGATRSTDFPVTDGSLFAGGIVDTIVLQLGAAGADGLTRVVEYFNADLGHYFITADPVERTLVDTGALGKWLRTGNVFVSSGLDAVCRFYGNVNLDPVTARPLGPNSHFYTSSASECAYIKSLFDAAAKSWMFESNDFSTMTAAQRTCPLTMLPIYRAYNDGFSRGIDSNHRITSNKGAYQFLVDTGWIGEGIVMCALQ